MIGLVEGFHRYGGAVSGPSQNQCINGPSVFRTRKPDVFSGELTGILDAVEGAFLVGRGGRRTFSVNAPGPRGENRFMIYTHPGGDLFEHSNFEIVNRAISSHRNVEHQ